MKELEEKELERVVLTQCLASGVGPVFSSGRKEREQLESKRKRVCCYTYVLQTPSAHKSNKGGLSLTRIINVQLSLNTHLIIIFKYTFKTPLIHPSI
jgi:hypothetical protein